MALLIREMKDADPYGRDIPTKLPIPLTAGGEAVSTGPYIPPWLKPIRLNERDVLLRMRRHLDENEPRVIRWLYSTWNANRGVLDEPRYQEIRNALIGLTPDGAHVPQEAVDEWQRQYAEFVNTRLEPRWRAAIEAGAETVTGRIGSISDTPFVFTSTGRHVDEWITMRAGELAKNLTESQVRAVRAVVRYHAISDPVAPAELARRIRPIIGLTETEAGYVTNLQARLAEEGLQGPKLARQVQNYADFLHRRRASRIARTELSHAYNQGGFAAVRQARDEGVFRHGEIVKIWNAAPDACEFCSELNGKRVGLDDTFPTVFTIGGENVTQYTPPAHPNCRCTADEVYVRA